MADWDQLRVVLAIHRAGGLSGAARALGVTHTTVSRALDRAEEALGVRLFTRLATGLEVTEAGEAAVARATLIEAEVTALSTELAARDEARTGPLTVTAPPLVMRSGLAEIIAEFSRDNPGIDLRLLGQDRLLDLHKREADVAIRVSRTPADSLWGRVIARQSAVWCATPSFLAAHHEGLAGHAPLPILGFVGWAQPVPQSLLEVYPTAQAVACLDDMVSALELARAGVGMLRMPLFLGQTDPDFVRVPGLGPIDYPPIWALTHPDLRHAPRIANFMGTLARGFTARERMFSIAPGA